MNYLCRIHATVCHNTSIGAINNCIRSTLHVLHEYLVPVYVKLPTKKEAVRQAKLFATAGGDNGQIITNAILALVAFVILQYS